MQPLSFDQRIGVIEDLRRRLEPFRQHRKPRPAPRFPLLSTVRLSGAVEDSAVWFVAGGAGTAPPIGALGTVLRVFDAGAAYIVQFAEPAPCLVTVRGSSMLVEHTPADDDR